MHLFFTERMSLESTARVGSAPLGVKHGFFFLDANGAIKNTVTIPSPPPRAYPEHYDVFR